MSHYFTIPPPPQFNLPCLLLDKNTPNYCIKFDIVSITLHSSQSKNLAKFYSLMYYRELCSSIKKFDSTTCLFLFRLDVCLLIKGKVNHHLFFEKVQKNFLKLSHGNSFKVIYCKPLSLLKMGWWSVLTPEIFWCHSLLNGLWLHIKKPSMWIIQCLR
jgi:hypothetical protein